MCAFASACCVSVCVCARARVHQVVQMMDSDGEKADGTAQYLEYPDAFVQVLVFFLFICSFREKADGTALYWEYPDAFVQVFSPPPPPPSNAHTHTPSLPPSRARDRARARALSLSFVRTGTRAHAHTHKRIEIHTRARTHTHTTHIVGCAMKVSGNGKLQVRERTKR